MKNETCTAAVDTDQPEVTPTELVMSDEHREALRAHGIADGHIDYIVKTASASGVPQEEFDLRVAEDLNGLGHVKEVNDKAAAERKAEERAAQRAAFAGMALQGFLANPAPEGPQTFAAVTKASVQYADALVAALEAPAETE